MRAAKEHILGKADSGSKGATVSVPKSINQLCMEYVCIFILTVHQPDDVPNKRFNLRQSTVTIQLMK